MELHVPLGAPRADTSATGSVRAAAAERESAAASSADATPEESTHERLRRDRHAFLKLLRDGVQRKVSDELHRSSRSVDAATRDGDDCSRGCTSNNSAHTSASALAPDAQFDQCSQRAHSSSSSKHAAAWRTLAWRDAYSTEPFFEETVNGSRLQIQQILQGELNGFGTGLTVWPAACVLLKHLDYRFCETNQLEGQFVLELGSGTGAVGIAAALLGAARVVLTDMDNIRFLMQANARLALEQLRRDNSEAPMPCIDVESYEWGAEPSAAIIPRSDDTDATTTHEQLPDLILVSDCILPRLYPIEPLVAALDRLSAAHTRVLISYEHRYFAAYDPKHRFWDLMRARGFELRVLERDEFHPHYVADDIEIWDVVRR